MSSGVSSGVALGGPENTGRNNGIASPLLKDERLWSIANKARRWVIAEMSTFANRRYRSLRNTRRLPVCKRWPQRGIAETAIPPQRRVGSLEKGWPDFPANTLKNNTKQPKTLNKEVQDSWQHRLNNVRCEQA